MEELANEGMVEPGLPFLDDGHFLSCDSRLFQCILGLVPKYTGCHVLASSVVPVQLVQVSSLVS